MLVESRDWSDGEEEPDGSSDDEDEDEEDEDSQVVPWSTSEEVLSSNICGRELKRRRDVDDLDSDVRTNQRLDIHILFKIQIQQI